MTTMDVNVLNTKSVVQLKTVVGRTYDALKSSYASPENVFFTKPILDMSKITIVENKLNINYTDYMAGNSLKELAKEFSVSVNVGSEIKMFSGSVSTDFKKESESSSEMSYCKVLHKNIKKRQGFSNVNDYKKFLIPEFEIDLKYLIPEDFFKEYGTHLITDAWFGGRLEFNFSKEKSINESKESLKVNVKAAFGKIFTSEITTNFSENSKEVIENSSMSARIVGGTSLQITTLENFSKEYRKWLNSLESEKNWEFCALPPNGGLVPLWELCDDYSRKKELEKYYLQLAAKAENKLTEDEVFLENIKFVHHDSETQAKRNCPAGYTLIDKDLNAGAGGEYIYLCYKLAKSWDRKSLSEAYGEQKWDPITNCFLMESKVKRNSRVLNTGSYQGIESKYIYDDVNLNQGISSKNYIYLSYTRDKKMRPIKNLAVVFDNEEISTEDWEVLRWYENDQVADLNKGVKGKYIYIYMKRAKDIPILNNIVEMSDKEKALARKIADENIRKELDKRSVSEQNEKQVGKEKEKPEELSEDSEFKVLLKELGSTKIATIKLIREITGKTLAESKAMVERLPATIKEKASNSEAKNIRVVLEAIGAHVEINQIATLEGERFDLILKSLGNKKVDAIKLVKEITGEGLKEAKAIAESTPVTLKKGISKDEFKRLKAQLELIGCKVESK